MNFSIIGILLRDLFRIHLRLLVFSSGAFEKLRLLRAYRNAQSFTLRGKSTEMNSNDKHLRYIL